MSFEITFESVTKSTVVAGYKDVNGYVIFETKACFPFSAVVKTNEEGEICILDYIGGFMKGKADIGGAENIPYIVFLNDPSEANIQKMEKELDAQLYEYCKELQSQGKI